MNVTNRGKNCFTSQRCKAKAGTTEESGCVSTFDGYDKRGAESILFDFVTELQTNNSLIADFGQLYNQPRTKDEATLKRISHFVTNNRIRVEAHTALTPMRGRLYQQHRPDFILRDDLENA